jgi:hypothetical protein
MTYREYLLKSEGYGRVIIEDYRQLRMLTYTIASPYLKDQNMTAYEFMPLEGDPTPEEIREHERERLEKEMQAAQERRQQILLDFKKRNGRF